LWGAWTLGLVAVLAPRPLGLTALRTIAPLFVVVAVLLSTAASPVAAIAAVVATLLNAVLAARAPTAMACVGGSAYGDEVRHPLEVPPALLVGPLPLAVLLVGAGVAAGPLLLADGQVVAGIVAVAVGLPLAGFLVRSLHGLSRRWAILVPAGLLVVDPMTLADPVLFTREQIARLTPDGRGRAAGPDEVDLRLGATSSSLEVSTRDHVHLARMLGRRRGAKVIGTRHVLFAPVRAGALLRVAAERRLPVQAATALPTTTSSS
jgi:hypothetical protein